MGQFSARFIIKTVADDAFSENSAFKDILYIADKRQPAENDRTAIVILKKPIKQMQSDDVTRLCADLHEIYDKGSDTINDTCDVKFVKTKDLCNYSTNMMPLLGFKSHKNSDTLQNFIATIQKKADKRLAKIRGDIMEEGLHTSPKNLSKVVFITKPIVKDRVSKAFMILRKIDAKSITAEIRNTGKKFKIPLKYTKPALRTLTGVKQMNADDVDHILVQEPKRFNEIAMLAGWKGDFDWFAHNKNIQKKASHVIVSRRFRVDSPNTHHMAYYSKRKVVAPDALKIIEFGSSEDAVLQTLFLNSSITLASFLLYRSQATQGYTNIMEADWIKFDIFDVKNLSDNDRDRLLALYEKLQNIEFPSIKDQFVTNNRYRLELDSTILSVLGFDQKSIDSTLAKLYKVMVDEISVD